MALIPARGGSKRVPLKNIRQLGGQPLIAYTIGVAIMTWYIFSGRARVTPVVRGLRIRRDMFFDILKVGAVSCFSPLQSVLDTVAEHAARLCDSNNAVPGGFIRGNSGAYSSP